MKSTTKKLVLGPSKPATSGVKTSAVKPTKAAVKGSRDKVTGGGGADAASGGGGGDSVMANVDGEGSREKTGEAPLEKKNRKPRPPPTSPRPATNSQSNEEDES